MGPWIWLQWSYSRNQEREEPAAAIAAQICRSNNLLQSEESTLLFWHPGPGGKPQPLFPNPVVTIPTGRHHTEQVMRSSSPKAPKGFNQTRLGWLVVLQQPQSDLQVTAAQRVLTQKLQTTKPKVENSAPHTSHVVLVWSQRSFDWQSHLGLFLCTFRFMLTQMLVCFIHL